MEDNNQNTSTAAIAGKTKKKKIVSLIVAVIAIAVVAIVVYSVATRNSRYAGTYYEITEDRRGWHYIGSYVELTESGEYLEEGLLGSFKSKSGGTITISQSVFGATIRMKGTIKKGVLTVYGSLWDSSSVRYYVRLDSPPENIGPFDEIPNGD